MSDQSMQQKKNSEFNDHEFFCADAGTAGFRLRAAREKMRMTVECAAEALKISVRQIGFIEADQWENFPAPAIAKGFVRSYAKLLGLNPGELVSLLPLDYAAVNLARELKPTLETPFLESKTKYLGKADPGNNLYLIGAFVLAVAVLMFGAYQFFGGSVILARYMANEPAVDEHVTLSSVPASKGELTGERVSESKALSVVEKFQQTSNAVVSASQPVSSVNTGSLSAAVIESVPVENKLQIVAQEDSWVQIKRKNGTLVYSKLLKSGVGESFDVNDGLQIKIGNARGVELTLRGRKYEFPVSPETNVANLFVE